MSPSSASPTFSATATCAYCQNPIATADIPSITALVQDHGLPVGLCLRCTLDELERLEPPLDYPADTPPTYSISTPSHKRGGPDGTAPLPLPTADNLQGEV